MTISPNIITAAEEIKAEIPTLITQIGYINPAEAAILRAEADKLKAEEVELQRQAEEAKRRIAAV